MYLELPRISPYLKGLAETRARADGDYEKASRSVAERSRHLNYLIQQFEASKAAAERALVQAEKEADAAMRTRNACDQLIRHVNEGLNPVEIEPIRAWQGRYGKRGALTQAIQQIIEKAYPAEVSTGEIAAQIQQQFGFTFGTVRERRLWKDKTILTRLQLLTTRKVIERLHDASLGTQESGRWRALPCEYERGSLIDLATQAGIPLTYLSEDFGFEGLDEFGETLLQ